MHDLSVCAVTRDNWRATLALAVHPDQQHFVAEHAPVAALVLAKAYVRPGGLTWLPYAFYVGTQPIGLVALAYEPDSTENYWIFHFFIDAHWQGQGYGRRALQLFVAVVRAHCPGCRAMQLLVHPENQRARRLYTSIGFQPTGGEIDGEAVYRLGPEA